MCHPRDKVFRVALPLYLIIIMLLNLTLCSASLASPSLPNREASVRAYSINSPINPYLTQQASIEDKFITVNGVNLHYVDKGKGQAIVLLHGNDGTLEDFTFSIFDSLTNKYRTLAFDRPGHGKSETPANTAPIPEVQAILLHNALHKLGINNPILVAHSWSGSLALSYALLFPNEVSALVLLGPMAYETKNTIPKISYYALQMPVIGTLVASLYKITGKNEIRKQLKEAFMPSSTPKVYEDEFLASLFRIRQIKAAAEDEITVNGCFRRISPYYSKIKVPVTILASGRK